MEDMKKLFHSILAMIIAVFLIPISNCLSVHDTFMYHWALYASVPNDTFWCHSSLRLISAAYLAVRGSS